MLNPHFKYANLHEIPVLTEFKFDTYLPGVDSVKFIDVHYGGSSGGTFKTEAILDTLPENGARFRMTGIVLKKNKRTTVIGLSEPYECVQVFNKETQKFDIVMGTLKYQYHVSVDSPVQVGLEKWDYIKSGGRPDYQNPNYINEATEEQIKAWQNFVYPKKKVA